jgi:hypothetical protein
VTDPDPASEPPPIDGLWVRDVPPIPITPISRRHELLRMSAGAPPKGANTIVLPEVDLRGDLDAIRRGEAWYDRHTRRIWVRGRLYEHKPHGTLFPIRGEGFVELDRQTYKALRLFRRYNEIHPDALRELSLNPDVTDEQRDTAIRLWSIREQALRERT